MVVRENKIFQLYQDCIANTWPKAIVKNQTILCVKTRGEKIYLTSRVLKHLYDKRTAAIYFLILTHLEKVLSTPDAIYKNKFDKRGNLILVKAIKEILVLVSLEKVKQKHFAVVTAFEIEEKYLNNLVKI